MRTAAALLLVGLAAVACTTTADPPSGGPSTGGPSQDRGYALFDPDLGGADPVETTTYDDHVATAYAGSEFADFTLVQQPAPGRPLCAALVEWRLAGDTCRVTDGVMVTGLEELGGVALVRDGTLLFVHGLVTEADPGLLDRAVEALRTAPRTSLTDLGEVVEGEATTTAEPTPVLAPGDFEVAAAVRTVRHLAGTIGAREATSPAFQRASRWVAQRFDRLGYSVQRQPVDVPAGSSWGVPVPAGRSVNVIAWPPGFTGEEPHLVVGAHLDTVPQAPGAEDNASGVGVMLAAAEVAALRRSRLPVVFVAFGAEEPRGETDDDHHYGSRAYVAALSPAGQRAVRGMLSLDRVGVGSVVPVGAVEGQPSALVRAARRVDVPVAAETGQRSSDHWSFVRAGLPGLRVGSTPYAGYHSAADVPSVVNAEQLERVGRLVLAWLAGPRSR